MKKISYFIFLSILVTACVSSKKYLQQGRYDAAIEKAVHKLLKKPANEKEAIVLDKAYKLANDRDNERIIFLKREGSPDIWEEVFAKYLKLQIRQNLVKPVLPMQIAGKSINYPQIDYDLEIINAKKKAAEYFYVHAMKMLEEGSKLSARKAFYEFQKVKNYYKTYKDVDKYLSEAKAKGMSKIQVRVTNQSMMKITREFEEILLNIDYKNLNSEWVDYYIEEKEKGFFDYTANIKLKIIDVLPEKVKEEHITETKEVDDGWEYVLDESGNVKKDSLGNDIKTAKTKIISCKLIKVDQLKVTHIKGDIEYMANFTGKIIKSDPVAADFIFEHHYATALGDLNALTTASKKLIKIKPLPFPNDMDMIYGAGEVLNKSINNVLRNNRRTID